MNWKSPLWFVAVGSAAALTHILVFAALRGSLWPELANATGFVVAFFVSFFGHRYLSFRGTSTRVVQSLGRFALTAVAGFVTNELLFVVLYRSLGWDSMSALFAALLAAAGQTWVLSNWWAFRR